MPVYGQPPDPTHQVHPRDGSKLGDTANEQIRLQRGQPTKGHPERPGSDPPDPIQVQTIVTATQPMMFIFFPSSTVQDRNPVGNIMEHPPFLLVLLSGENQFIPIFPENLQVIH